MQFALTTTVNKNSASYFITLLPCASVYHKNKPTVQQCTLMVHFPFSANNVSYAKHIIFFT